MKAPYSVSLSKVKPPKAPKRSLKTDVNRFDARSKSKRFKMNSLHVLLLPVLVGQAFFSAPAYTVMLQEEREDTGFTPRALPQKSKALSEPAVNNITLVQGGIIWATEDPTLDTAQLSFSSTNMALIEKGSIEEIPLSINTNYAAFLERLEILVFDGKDIDLSKPLYTQSVTPAALQTIQLTLPDSVASRFFKDDELRLVIKAYDQEGNFDQTFAQVITLVDSAEKERQLSLNNFNATPELRPLTQEEREQRELVSQSLNSSQSLRHQNIPIYGSNIRIKGQGITPNSQIRINDAAIPVDVNGNFIASYLLPIGSHDFQIGVNETNHTMEHTLTINVTGKYKFLVALADITASKNRISGSIEPLSSQDSYDDSLVEGRLAFYLKGKVKGKYLITAHMDTDELPLDGLFSGFFKETPRDIFRRLDPDMYYPVYGDDSYTIRDVDTQGKLYVRVDWDKNQALFGNFQTGITGTQYGHYARSLYGAAFSWRSTSANEWGDAKTETKVFASEAQTSYGHSEFLGTGGSLYYLKHTDILPGSEVVTLEIRDIRTGNIESRAPLIRGVDYEVDELQGRIILARPLMQIASGMNFSITRHTPLGEQHNVLLIDYEYFTRGIKEDETTSGVRAKHWFGDHVALGATYIRESRQLQDYELQGVDLRLQAARGTYVSVEQNESKASATRVFVSDNGGLTFNQLNLPTYRKGDAFAVDARANLQELGLTSNLTTLGGWYRDLDSGFSVSRYDYGLALTEKGAELSSEIFKGFYANFRYSQAERSTHDIEEYLAQLDARLNAKSRLITEYRHAEETRANFTTEGSLGALRYQYSFSSALEAYLQGQVTLDDNNQSASKNNLTTLGGTYSFTNSSSILAEASTGTRGEAYRLSGDYRLNPNHTLYTSYSWSTDTTAAYDPLFNNTPTGLTLGQRWRVSDKTNVFNESQWLKAKDEQGTAHTFGMDFYPTTHWSYGFTLQKGTLDAYSGQVERDAYSLRGGYNNLKGSWRSALEWREDSGAEQREQWVSTNTLNYKYSEDLRVGARINLSKTTDKLNSQFSAQFRESNLGFAYRPHDNTRWALLGKYTHLYDVSTGEQLDSVAWYDQKSDIVSVEGTFDISSKWTLAAKLAQRFGEARENRGQGDWFDSQTTFYAAQARYALAYKWNAVLEYRTLDVKHSGDRQGWLAAIDRNLSENLRLGVGYNFTDFSDDLRRHDYKYKGFFINLVGYY